MRRITAPVYALLSAAVLAIPGCSETGVVQPEAEPVLGHAKLPATAMSTTGVPMMVIGTGHAVDVNNRNQVLARYLESFIWDRGSRTTVESPGSTGGNIVSMNNSGLVAGNYGVPDDPGSTHAFVWYDGTAKTLPTLPGDSYSHAYDVNSRGDVAGASFSSRSSEHAVIWSGREVLELPSLPDQKASMALGINNAGRAVGWVMIDWQFRAVLWDNGVVQALETPSGSSYATAINNRGQIVGYRNTGDGYARPVRWEHGRIEDLATLPGMREGVPYDINERGDIVGYAIVKGGISAVLWRRGQITNLGSLPGGQNHRNHQARAVNDRGEIVGWSYYEGPFGPNTCCKAVMWLPARAN